MCSCLGRGGVQGLMPEFGVQGDVTLSLSFGLLSVLGFERAMLSRTGT